MFSQHISRNEERSRELVTPTLSPRDVSGPHGLINLADDGALSHYDMGKFMDESEGLRRRRFVCENDYGQ